MAASSPTPLPIPAARAPRESCAGLVPETVARSARWARGMRGREIPATTAARHGLRRISIPRILMVGIVSLRRQRELEVVRRRFASRRQRAGRRKLLLEALLFGDARLGE